jgi:hypothetical protein
MMTTGTIVTLCRSNFGQSAAVHLDLDNPLRPTHVSHSTITAIANEMRWYDREELVHYAGASYRDDVAWQMCLAWLADPTATEQVLKGRALVAAGYPA